MRFADFASRGISRLTAKNCKQQRRFQERHKP
jgi:hypothetical protein